MERLSTMNIPSLLIEAILTTFTVKVVPVNSESISYVLDVSKETWLESNLLCNCPISTSSFVLPLNLKTFFDYCKHILMFSRRTLSRCHHKLRPRCHGQKPQRLPQLITKIIEAPHATEWEHLAAPAESYADTASITRSRNQWGKHLEMLLPRADWRGRRLCTIRFD